jgi:hypothetical protein
MGNVPLLGPVHRLYHQQGQQQQGQQQQDQQQHHQQAPRGPHVIDDAFWETCGIHWEGDSTRCILDDPYKAFGPIPNGAQGDTIKALGFEQHIFSTICGMIRSRAYQLHNQAYPSDSNFFRSYTITLGSPRGWSGAGVRRIIDHLKFNCGPPSNQRADVQWEAHQCNIHHLPRDNLHILQLLGRSEGSPHDPKLEDRATVEYMGDIYKFEFQEFQKQQRRDPTLTLQNVEFLCEAPLNVGKGLINLREKWETMWDASTIHPHGRSRAGHLSGAEGLQSDTIHQHGERVISSAGHPIVVENWPYDPIRPSGVERRMYDRHGEDVRSRAGHPIVVKERQFDSQHHAQGQQMRQHPYRSEEAQTDHDFLDSFHSNQGALLQERSGADRRRSPHIAGGGGGNIHEVVPRAGWGHGGNGGRLVQKPKVLNQVPDENRLRELEYMRLQHEMDAKAGARNDMVGRRLYDSNQEVAHVWDDYGNLHL